MTTTWFSSDWHFGHERINELADRPFKSVTEMNETIVENWNSVVEPDHSAFVLGDVAMGKIDESLPIIAALNGHKTLILGNHDRPWIEYMQMLRYRKKGNEAKANKHMARAEDFMARYKEVFDHVETERWVDLGDRKVALSHFPYDGDSHDEDRYSEARLHDTGMPLIHGHTHVREKVSHSAKGTLQIHVGVDAWDYAPVSADTVSTLIEGYHFMWDYPKEES